MGNSTSQYAFSRLPNRAIRKVLIAMNLTNLFTMSFCSKRALSHVKSLKAKGHMSFEIRSNIVLTIQGRNYSSIQLFFNPENSEEWVEGNDPIKLDRFDSIVLRSTDLLANQEERWLEQCQLSLKDCIAHVSNVFKPSFTFVTVTIDESGQRFDYGSLCATFGGPQISLLFFHGLPVVFCNQFASVFEQVEQFNFEGIPHISMESLSKMIMQNSEAVVFHPSCQVSVKPDDLLIINIPDIDIMSVIISDKEINRFIKLWIAGCNLKLKKLMFRFATGRVLNPNVILHGIRHIDVSEQQEATMRLDGYIVTKGYIIKRSTDFVEAIFDFNKGPATRFEFTVCS